MTPVLERTELIMTRGLPASGKSRWAREWVRAAGEGQRAEVNRDALRMMLFGCYPTPPLGQAREDLVTLIQDRLVTILLANEVSVVVSDTNLRPEDRERFEFLALVSGAAFSVQDMTGVSLEECLRRNAARTDKPPVPENWMRQAHAAWIAPEGAQP